MVRVDRGPPPAGLGELAGQLLAEFDVEYVHDGDLTMTAYWGRVRRRLRQFADVLAERHHGKCAFCEATARHVSHLHVEHYRPKGLPAFERLAFDWSNWLSSCALCNQIKWKHFPICGEVPCLLNPADDDPRAHVGFTGPYAVGKTDRGEKTVSLVGLDRPALEEQRQMWLLTIDCLLLLVLRAEDARVDARRLLIWAMQPDAPFSSMTRDYLSEKTPILANPPEPHPTVHLLDGTRVIGDLIQQHSFSLRLLQ